MASTSDPPASQSPRPPSAVVIAGNDDILTEILTRLPVKSLVRFKSVSKHWSSLISAGHFSLLHTLRNPNPKPSGLLLRKIIPHRPTALTAAVSDFDFVSFHGGPSAAPPFRSLHFVNRNSGTKILQSVNGLFLCCSFPHSIETVRNYYIVNPTTKQFLALPPPPDCASTTVFGVNLAFDPSKSPHYNVIWVRSSVSSIYCHQIEIYSSKHRCWRISGDFFKAPFDMVFNDGVLWNGSVHWLSPSGASLRFNVELECLGEMPAVPTVRRVWGGRRYRIFCESNGHLHLIDIYGQTTQFKVFEMDTDYSGWFVKYSVDLDGVGAAFPAMFRECREGINYAYSILAVVREDDEDESVLVLNVPGKVLSYSFDDGTLKELQIASGKYKKNTLQFGCFDSYKYSETLAPV